MRELTLEELELISGGNFTCELPRGDDFDDSWGDTGGDWGDDWYDGDYGGGDGGGPSPGPSYPAGFDPVLDDTLDSAAAQLGSAIMAMSDAATQSYAALIWRDGAGTVHTTSIAAIAGNADPVDALRAQVDFAGGGQILSVLQSHASLFNAGSAESPNWQPVPQSDILSSVDFDRLLANGGGAVAGVDTANYRSYLVTQTGITEYYAFEQDASYVGAGGAATWAVQSSDYGS